MASNVSPTTQDIKGKNKDSLGGSDVHSSQAVDLTSPEICVICLDRIINKAIALPCKHDQFDFPCLGTWIQQSQVCPLCKAEVRAIRYDVRQNEDGGRIFYLPTKDIPQRRPIQEINRRRARAGAHHPYYSNLRRGSGRQQWGQRPSQPDKEDRALEFRREVYEKRMFSAYVGANRISRYRNITPQSFVIDASLVNRAKIFIRRELQVFDFLNPNSVASNPTSDRRASNAEFLLEYIVGILRSIDLKGSNGQAEELLRDFLGRDHSQLFLHELEAWLRSPYERLSDWDKHVQYNTGLEAGGGAGSAHNH